jgi:hypothetical protein
MQEQQEVLLNYSKEQGSEENKQPDLSSGCLYADEE